MCLCAFYDAKCNRNFTNSPLEAFRWLLVVMHLHQEAISDEEIVNLVKSVGIPLTNDLYSIYLPLPKTQLPVSTVDRIRGTLRYNYNNENNLHNIFSNKEVREYFVNFH